MPMYKKVMLALGIILLLVAGISFYEYQQSSQAVDLSTLSSGNRENDTGAENRIAVYVTGEVAKPGVVYVPWDGRVGDAVNQCGGLLPTADSSQVNMAAAVKDGMEIRVKGKTIAKDSNMGNKVNSSGGTSGTVSKSRASEQDKNASGEMVNINTADVEGLRKLKGIGPAMAQRIIDYRESNGSFQAPEDSMQVKGIGKAKYEKIKGQIAI